MGQRGKLRLPAHLRPVTSSDTSVTVADRVKPGTPARPHGFPTGHADLSALWDELVPKLDTAGLVTPVDGMAIELALRHFVAARAASDDLAKRGVTVRDANHGGTKKAPADAVFRSQSAEFREYVKQLGMSFAARARIDVPPETAEDDFFGDPAPKPAQSGPPPA